MNKILTTAVLGLFAIPAFAIPNPIPNANELPDFDQFDVNITVPSYQDRVIYKFTPDTPGTLTVLSVSKSSDMDLFVSEMYDSSNYTVIAERWSLGTFMEDVPAGYNFGYVYNMTPDQVFYISIPLTNFNNATEVKFLWEEKEVSPSAITYILPDPNDVVYYDYLTEQNIVVQADGPVSSFGEVTISYLDQVVQIRGNRRSGPVNGEFLTIATADPGSTNYVLPAVEAGADSFTITVKDYKVNGMPVTGNNTGNPDVKVEDGTVSFSYKLTKAPEYIAAESTWPSTFYSSWQKGDPLGMATLVFDQPIEFIGEATLIMAPYTLGEVGGDATATTYPLATKVDGNKVIIDFTGNDYSGSTSIVSVLVVNVRGVNGLPSTFGGYNTVLVEQISYVNQPAPENPDIPNEPDVPDTPDTPDNPETPEYLEHLASVVNSEISDLDPTVELLWNETVTVIDPETLEVPLYKGGAQLLGNLSADYFDLVDNGESGTTMFIMLGESGLLQEPGLYTLRLPEGIVENEEGAVNKPQMIAVTYVVETDSIEAIDAENGAKVIYNINGMKVNENNLGKGVYIINGKKILKTK